MASHGIHYTDIPVDEYFEKGVHRTPTDFFETNGEYSISIIRFDPGQGGNLHYHRAPVEEFYFVLDGELDVRVGDEVVHADAGTIVYTPPETNQQPMNNSDAPAEIFVVRGPGTDGRVETLATEWSPP